RRVLSFPLFHLTLPPPVSPLFPYTTLFRSVVEVVGAGDLDRARAECRVRVVVGDDRDQPPVFLRPDRDLAQLAHDRRVARVRGIDRKSTRLNSSHVKISYAVFCLKKKTIRT